MEGHGGGLKQSKLLAAFAVLAMVVCAFAFVAPANDADADTATSAKPINTGDEFVAAIDGTGGNYVLTKDITVTFTAKYTIEKSIYSCTLDSTVVIDLNGHTVTATGGYAIQITSDNKDTAKLTLSNGTINWTGFTGGNKSAFSIEKNGSLCLNTVNFTTNGAAVYPNGDASKVEIINCTIVAGTYAIGTNNGVSKNNELSIDVSRSTLSGTGAVNNDKDNCTVIINIPNAKLTITDSTIYGERQSLFIRCGTATVTNTDIYYTNAYTGSTASSYDNATWGSGDEAPMSAVLVGDNKNNTYGGLASLTMTGCTINASSGKAILTSTDNDTTLSLKLNSTTVSIDGNAAVLDGITITEKGFKISQGSIIIDGAYTVATTGGTITLTSGEGVVRSIPANADIVVAQGAKLTVNTGETLTVSGSITVQDGATLAVDGTVTGTGTITINEKGKMNVGGSITGTVSITGTGKVTVGVNGTIASSVNVDPATPVVIDESGMETQYVGGTASTGVTNYSPNQIVQVIDGKDWKLVSGAIVTIKGQLVVPEGSKVIIEDGAQLIIEGKIASEIDGVVTLESDMDSTEIFGGYLKIVNSTVNFNADVEINGLLEVATKGVANFNANVTVTADGNITADTVKETVKVSEVSVMTVNGSMNVAKISNYGAVVIDSAVASGSSSIALLASGATVNVVKYTVSKAPIGTLTITDADLEIGKNSPGLARTNTVTITPNTATTATAAFLTVYGITVTENAVITNITNNVNQKYIDNTMAVAGDVKTSFATDEESTNNNIATVGVELLAGAGTTSGLTPEATVAFTVSDALVIGQNVSVTLKGELAVYGTVTAIAKADSTGNAVSAFIIDDATGNLVLEDAGLVQILNTGTTSALVLDNVEAAVYETTVDTTTKYWNYVTIDSALDNANADSKITKVQVLNKQTVSKDNTVPVGLTLTVSYDMSVGDEKNTDVVLKIAADAGKINITTEKKIIVFGTLYAENKSKLNTEAQVQSDVKSEQLNEKGVPVKNGWAKFTNLYTAMSEANAGETVTVSTTTLDIKKNLTVKDGVTLAIPTGVTAKIYEGVTVIVNGYIVTDSEISTGNTSTVAAPPTTVFGKTASTVENKAAVVLGPNGYIASSVENIAFAADEKSTKFTSLPVAGAFYNAEIDDAPYHILSSLEVALGMKDKITGTITLDGKVTAGDISFAAVDEDTCKSITLGDNADVVFQSMNLDGTSLVAINGDFSGAVTVAGVTVTFAHVKNFTVADVGDVMKFTTSTTGNGFASAASTGEKASITLTAGTMKASIGSTVKFVVASGATLEATETPVTFKELVIDGTVSVPSKAQLTGTTTTINENGTLNVAMLTATEDKGTFTVTTLNAGIVGSDYHTTSAAASVSGPIALDGTSGTAYVAAGVAIADGTFPTATKSTALYIGDKLWMTVYTLNNAMTFDDVTLNGKKNPIENGKFLDWVDEKGNSLTNPSTVVSDGKKIGYVDKAIAKIDYNVYAVRIVGVAGVADVSIDGNVYTGVTVLTAGEHKITYNLAIGYSGNAKLEINGAVNEGTTCTINGLSFNISGAFNDDYADNGPTPVVTLQLTGIEKTGYVPDSPDTEKTGMTLTDILLIVLVVLIVVMAIIVAMRMMRS